MKRFASLLSVLVMIGSLTIAFFVGRSGYEAYRKNEAIESEIAKIEAEAERISIENSMLEKKIAYLKTDAFTEREAKEKLNLKHKDEQVVSVKGVSIDSEQEEESPGKMVTDLNEDANPVYKRWWKIFFGYDEV